MRPQMFESLETRRLMSGNVSVTFAGGLLSIIGDNKSNVIEVEGGTGLAGVTVTGFNGTTVNGQPAVFTNTGGLPPDTRISLGNGEDIVVVHPANGVTPTVANLSIDTGNGNDEVFVVPNGAPFQSLNLDINTGNGDDGVLLQGIQAFNDINVNLGNGDDVLVADNVGALGNIKIDGGRGNDTLVNGGSIFSVFGSVSIVGFENFI